MKVIVFPLLPGLEINLAVVPLVSNPDLCHAADNESNDNTVNSGEVMVSCLP